MKKPNNSFVFEKDISKWQEGPVIKDKKYHNVNKEGFIVRRNKGRAGNL